jgi:cell division protein FtsW
MTTTSSRRTPSPGPGRGDRSGADASRPSAAVIAVQRIFSAETPEYFLLLGTTLFLVVFGLIMVLSSSSIESYVNNDKDFFATATRQGLYVLIGLPVMLIAARAPLSFWKRWAGPAVIAGVVLQLLVFVPGLGYGYGGNQNWIKLGSFTAQPSEVIKLALVIWLARILSRRLEELHDWKRALIPIGPVVAVSIGLVLVGRDLGTALIMVAIVFGAMFIAGTRLRILGVVILVAGLVGLVGLSVSTGRVNRIHDWLSGCKDAASANYGCYQTLGGWQALAHGGVLGVGLGNSTAKWNWLPEAANDFIFAVIGEELGMFGAILVLLLFVVLAVAFVRIIRMSDDPFAKIATSAAMVWIVGQAFVNIAVVLGLLPVLGVPLPLISAGGSSLITTLAAIGVVLSFARHRPDHVSAGRAARGAGVSRPRRPVP